MIKEIKIIERLLWVMLIICLLIAVKTFVGLDSRLTKVERQLKAVRDLSESNYRAQENMWGPE